MQKGLELYNNLTDYVLKSNNIDYDINSELCVKYVQADKYLSSELINKYLEIEYKYMVEQNNNNLFDERTTYNLVKVVFSNEKYKNDKSTLYNILTNKYETLKKVNNDCRVSELNILKELYNSLGDYENSKNYVNEIDTALIWQGIWVAEKSKDKSKLLSKHTINEQGNWEVTEYNKNPEQLAISYFGKNIFDDYIFNGAYRYTGTYKFEIIDNNSLTIKQDSGSTKISEGDLRIENGKLILTNHNPYINDKETIFVRETNENNYADNANKVLENQPKPKTMPKVGMTASEVRSSTWGTPDKINKDTYSWGTTEQWVYNNLGYVYLENGIVTSVSQR